MPTTNDKDSSKLVDNVVIKHVLLLLSNSLDNGAKVRSFFRVRCQALKDQSMEEWKSVCWDITW